MDWPSSAMLPAGELRLVQAMSEKRGVRFIADYEARCGNGAISVLTE